MCDGYIFRDTNCTDIEFECIASDRDDNTEINLN
jgi:hypothetical protein